MRERGDGRRASVRDKLPPQDTVGALKHVAIPRTKYPRFYRDLFPDLC
jgi:hypothetical protein